MFGLSLGGSISPSTGVDYDVFIVPGLLTMAMIQAAYANNSASVFQARFDRYLNDVLAAPMRPWRSTSGCRSAASCARCCIGGLLLLATALVIDVPVRASVVLVAVALR